MRKITPLLYIGNMYAPQENGDEFDTVITLAPEEYPTSTDVFLIPDGDHDYALFEAAVNTTINSLQAGKKTLVHCQAGQSRSVSVASAALSTVENIPLDTAFYRCENTGVRPHPDLIESAKRFTGDDNIPFSQ